MLDYASSLVCKSQQLQSKLNRAVHLHPDSKSFLNETSKASLAHELRLMTDAAAVRK